MNHYWVLFKRSQLFYVLMLNLVTTVIVVNTLVEFTENLIKNHLLLYLSLLIFCLLLLVTIRKELWKHAE